MFHVVSSDSDQLKSACLDSVRGMLKEFQLPSNCKAVSVGKASKSKKPTTLLMLNLPPEDRAWRLKMVRLVDWVRTEYLEKRRSVIFVYRHKRARNVFEYLLDEEDLKLYPPDGWIQRLHPLQVANALHHKCRSSRANFRDVLENAATFTGLI